MNYRLSIFSTLCMNKSIQRLFFIFFFQLAFVFSCVQDYNLTDDLGMGGEVIINGILEQDSVPVIYLHRSASFRAEGDFELVDNASVKLYYRPMGLSDGELFEENLIFQDSYYKSDFVLLADYEYHLEVILADGSLMEASTYIPSPHRISSTRIVSPGEFAETPTVQAAICILASIRDGIISPPKENAPLGRVMT